MIESHGAGGWQGGQVPLFPLPNVVLLPGAILPLHIFEDRYKLMTADVLEGDRRIAMALLRPGWEKNYYAKPAIEPVVCVGQIVSAERLADGKYNFLLQGVARARLVGEIEGKPYRIGNLIPVEEIARLELDLEKSRRRLTELFNGPFLGGSGIGKRFRELLAGPYSTAAVADLAAFHYLEDLEFKQQLLGEVDVQVRIERVIEALETLLRQQKQTPGLHGFPADPGVN